MSNILLNNNKFNTIKKFWINLKAKSKEEKLNKKLQNLESLLELI